MILADTSAWIASFSKSGHEGLKKAMRDGIIEGSVATTGMVVLELLRGTRNYEECESLRKRLSILPFLSVDDSVWSAVAKLSLALRTKGVQVSLPDIFISHVAITNDCVILHCDRDFEMITKHTPLKSVGYE